MLAVVLFKALQRTQNWNASCHSSIYLSYSFSHNKSQKSCSHTIHTIHTTQIHVFGNTGFLGAVHAAVAPLSTKIIDDAAYNGQDVRKVLSEELARMVGKQRARVADLCCGVGISTRALQDAFPDAETVLGIDTSPEMISMAQFLTRHLAMVKPFFRRAAHQMKDSYKAMKKRGYATRPFQCYGATRFVRTNAENTHLPGKSFDLVTIMYGFHEAPRRGRERIMKEAHRLLAPGGTLAVIDISTDYEPSPSMLAGEPYVQEYQANIHRQLLHEIKGFSNARYRDVVPKHLGMWTLTRTAMPA